jgi:pilus assembly protein CpaB
MFRVLVLVGALLAGGLAAWLSFGMPNSSPIATAAAPATEIKTQDVLVATVDLPQGTALSDQGMGWQIWPQDAVNPGFIARSDRPDAIENLSGSIVRHPIIVGEPIREEKLAGADAGFLSALLPSGKRAVAVRISAENSAGGFILPNDRVDVIHTRRDDAGGRSRTILTSIRVLAIDQNSGDSGEESTAVGKTATLELDPMQAEAIAAAESSGALSLALRATADNDELPALAIHDEPPAPALLAEAPALARQSSGSVVIVRAGQSETVQTDGSVQ